MPCEHVRDLNPVLVLTKLTEVTFSIATLMMLGELIENEILPRQNLVQYQYVVEVSLSIATQ